MVGGVVMGCVCVCWHGVCVGMGEDGGVALMCMLC